MTYKTENKWIDEYEETGRNQHGTRYKKKYSSKRVRVAILSAKFDDADDLRNLIYLSDRLDVPVHWDSSSEPHIRQRLYDRRITMAKCEGKMNDGVYNCYGSYDHSICYHCKFNAGDEEFEKTGNMFKSYEDAVNELFSFLKGEGLPEGMKCKMPKLKPDMAFNIIWFLQEHMGILLDNIEMCQSCKSLFDTDSSGYYLSDEHYLLDENGDETDKPLPKKYWGHWCDNCVPNIEFSIP